MHTTTRALFLLATIAVGLRGSIGLAAEPELTHTRLFENHKTEAARLAALGPDGKSFKRHHNGMVNYRIPAMAISTKGTIIAMCNGRTGTGLDQCEYCTIVARRSTDGGKTWEPETTVLEIPYRSIFTGSAIVDPTTGEIMFFCHQWPMRASAGAPVECPHGVMADDLPPVADFGAILAKRLAVCKVCGDNSCSIMHQIDCRRRAVLGRENLHCPKGQF